MNNMKNDLETFGLISSLEWELSLTVSQNKAIKVTELKMLEIVIRKKNPVD